MRKIKWSKIQTISLVVDVLLLLLAGLFAYLFIENGFGIPLNIGKVNFVVISFVAFIILAFLISGTYKNLWKFAGINDIMRTVLVFVAGACAFYAFNRLCGTIMSNRFVVVLFVLGLVMVIAVRTASSYAYYLIKNIYAHKAAHPTLIVGAGWTGRMVLNELLRSKESAHPIYFADDDPEKTGMSINGIKVVGPIMLIPEIVQKYSIKTIWITIPSLPQDKMRKLRALCSGCKGCDVKEIPSLDELKVGSRLLSQARKMDFGQLLGREEIHLDNKEVKDFIKNKTCMVTGGGGSIGSELCRQIIKLQPKKLVVLDIYENNAYDLQQEIKNQAAPGQLSVEIASVRDRAKMESIFIKYRPDIVFHAAAHKHVPLMEDNPEEAVKNNICGTLNTATLAGKYGAEKFVLISTDKAVNPTNVMGATKRCCEMVVQSLAQDSEKTDFVAVRFGNVLGSNGSVIPLFKKQIEAGGPVTVTHKDIIRYFMTIPEAVSLVLSAGAMARGGEIFVLDMGESVKITTLAENVIRFYGYKPYTEMPIVFTGLRPGEKLYEELLMNEEGLRATLNDKIFVARQINIEKDEFRARLDRLIAAANGNDPAGVVAMLHETVDTYHDPEQINSKAEQG